MRGRFWKKIGSAFFLLLCLTVTTTFARTTQKDIDKAKDQINDLKDQREEAQDLVNDIEQEKEGLENQLNGLNRKMTELTGTINELEQSIAAQTQQIEEARLSLEEAEETQQKQYADMKVRIQYMYENSLSSDWESLMEGSSFSDFLNRAAYMIELNSYDRRLLEEYVEQKEQIAANKRQLETKLDELVAMEVEMKEKKDSVDGLIRTTQNDLWLSDAQLADAKSDVDDISAKLAKMEAYEKELEIKKAKEDAARLKAIKEQEQENLSGVTYTPAESDAYLLGAIIECEAGAESYEGKLAVGSVIMNRVKSSYFPNTVSGVIYQSGQFSPVASGRLAYRLQAGVSDGCMQAAQEVLNGNITLSCLYFRVNNGIISGIVIGNHVFY